MTSATEEVGMQPQHRIPKVRWRTNKRRKKFETHLQDLWEGFHHASVVVTVHLYDIDQCDLSFGALTEGRENRGEFLQKINGSSVIRKLSHSR